MPERAADILKSFHTDTPPRAIGTETEYTIQHNGPMLQLRYARAIDRYLIHPAMGINHLWTEGGGKMYFDLDWSHYDDVDTMNAYDDAILEYATPEASSATEAAIHEKAGEVLAELLARECSPDRRFPLFKRTAYDFVISSEGETLLGPASMGHHENYTTPAFGINTDAATEQLISYLATRPIWAGAGIVSESGYQLAQKYAGISYIAATNNHTTHGSKTPVIAGKLGRGAPTVEIRSGDGNMSLWAIRTKLAYTSLVLRLIEHGVFPATATIHDNEQREAMAKLASEQPGKAISGEMPNAIEHQLAIARQAIDFAITHDVPEEELQAALDVTTTCGQVRTWCEDNDALELLVDRVDWAAKLHLINRRLGKDARRLTSYNVDAVHLDLLWEAVGDRTPSTLHYKKFGNLPNISAIKSALTTPPATRAAARVAAIKAANPYTILSIDWEGVAYVGNRPDTAFDIM